MTKKKNQPKRSAGRPKSEYDCRYMIRHHSEQEGAWRVAAAMAGIQLSDWMRRTLDGEAQKPHHVPPITRD